MFLYGMKTFAALAATLVSAGLALGLTAPDRVVAGGWIGSLVLFVFAFGLLAEYKIGLNGSPGGEPDRP
jgi:hypothetical protein